MLQPKQTIVADGCFQTRFLNVDDLSEMVQAYQLRHEYFVRLKRWVIPNEAHLDLEFDAYDADAEHIAVFLEGKATGYLRIIDRQASCGFMIECEFAALVGKEYLTQVATHECGK